MADQGNLIRHLFCGTQDKMGGHIRSEEVRRNPIKDFTAHSDRNVVAMNNVIGSIRHQLLRIEADLDQSDYSLEGGTNKSYRCGGHWPVRPSVPSRDRAFAHRNDRSTIIWHTERMPAARENVSPRPS
jgi:hypothetical protein